MSILTGSLRKCVDLIALKLDIGCIGSVITITKPYSAVIKFNNELKSVYHCKTKLTLI